MVQDIQQISSGSTSLESYPRIVRGGGYASVITGGCIGSGGCMGSGLHLVTIIYGIGYTANQQRLNFAKFYGEGAIRLSRGTHITFYIRKSRQENVLYSETEKCYPKIVTQNSTGRGLYKCYDPRLCGEWPTSGDNYYMYMVQDIQQISSGMSQQRHA